MASSQELRLEDLMYEIIRVCLKVCHIKIEWGKQGSFAPLTEILGWVDRVGVAALKGGHNVIKLHALLWKARRIE
jgi:hypothetical protein